MGDSPPPAPLRAEDVRERVGRHVRRVVPAAALRAAAVLVPLVDAPGGLEVLLTLRPTYLPSHAGQVSFPGGRVDPGDRDVWDTALREAREEVGLPPEAVERVGLLDDLRTVTRYHVTPCVGLLPPGLPLVPCEAEVEDVFTVPLRDFLDPARLRTMITPRNPEGGRVHFFLVEPHIVWGATAAMLTHLLRVLGRPPAR